MSKKRKAKVRQTWKIDPRTRVVEDKKKYDRKKEKKRLREIAERLDDFKV